MNTEEEKSPLKSRVYTILEKSPGGDRPAFLIHAFLAIVILLNTSLVVIYTVPDIALKYRLPINILITVCLLIFAAEYILRLWSCTDAPTFKARTMDRLRHATRFYMIIDVISIVPLLFPFFLPGDFALLKTFRLLSIFKLGRYAQNSGSLALLKRVIFKKREIFTIMVFFLVFVILFSSTIMYLVENSAQPEKFSSIPAAMWWAVITVTTVGYGDIIPITPLGQTLASFITLAGVLLLALPSAILASGFIEERQKENETASEISPLNRIEILERLSALKEKEHISAYEFNKLKNLIFSGHSDSDTAGNDNGGMKPAENKKGDE
ncbi:MAG: ion transporter [Methanomicrobiaceae archaeon]|nr:ion transporter [Methanomicrobiaceae archaeon]